MHKAICTLLILLTSCRATFPTKLSVQPVQTTIPSVETAVASVKLGEEVKYNSHDSRYVTSDALIRWECIEGTAYSVCQTEDLNFVALRLPEKVRFRFEGGRVTRLLNATEYNQASAELVELQQAELRLQQQARVDSLRTAPAHVGDFTPVTVPFGGSPVIKGLFLGMRMEQVVDALNEKFLPGVADGKPKLWHRRNDKDFPYSVERLSDTRKDGAVTCEREWYVVDSRVLMDCICEEHGGRRRQCSTEKWYVLNSRDGKKTIFPDVSHRLATEEGYVLPALGVLFIVAFGNDNTLVEVGIDKDFFKAGDIPTADFARMIMDAYHIPKLDHDVSVQFLFNQYQSIETYTYRSQNGWEIKVSSFEVRLKRVTATSEVKLD